MHMLRRGSKKWRQARARTVSSSVEAGDVIQLKPIVLKAPAVWQWQRQPSLYKRTADRPTLGIKPSRGRAAQHLPQQPRGAGVCREIREEAGRLPVCYACAVHRLHDLLRHL